MEQKEATAEHKIGRTPREERGKNETSNEVDQVKSSPQNEETCKLKANIAAEGGGLSINSFAGGGEGRGEWGGENVAWLPMLGRSPT